MHVARPDDQFSKSLAQHAGAHSCPAPGHLQSARSAAGGTPIAAAAWLTFAVAESCQPAQAHILSCHRWLVRVFVHFCGCATLSIWRAWDVGITFFHAAKQVRCFQNSCGSSARIHIVLSRECCSTQYQPKVYSHLCSLCHLSAVC